MEPKTQFIWAPLLVLVVGTLIYHGLIGTVRRSRFKRKEKILYTFLTRNTEAKPGKRYLPIPRVIQETHLPHQDIIKILEGSSRIFLNPVDDKEIGLYAEFKSRYEEEGSGIIVF